MNKESLHAWVEKKYKCKILVDIPEGGGKDRLAGYFNRRKPNEIHLHPYASLHTLFHELGHRHYRYFGLVVAWLIIAAFMVFQIISFWVYHIPMTFFYLTVLATNGSAMLWQLLIYPKFVAERVADRWADHEIWKRRKELSLLPTE